MGYRRERFVFCGYYFRKFELVDVIYRVLVYGVKVNINKFKWF